MAAYAALVSLLNTINHIQNHPRFSASLDKHQVESLRKIIDFFLEIVEGSNSYGKEEIEKLEREIASAAHEAEDVLESYIVDQILPVSNGIIPHFTHLRRICLFDLQRVILDLNSIKNKVLDLEVKEATKFSYQKPPNFVPAASSIKSSMVGFDDELSQLMDVLIGQESSQQIISIVGMGGTGKTTLARYVYEDSLTMHHFDLRAWATISQQYDVNEILLQLLCIQGKVSSDCVDDLGLQLYQSLFGRRYLIVLDDMWSIEVWDSLKNYFPDNGDGSRVVLTTRLSNVATQLSSASIRINFLDEHKSWDLFCQKAFGQEDCPVELEGIGKTIAKQCKGLPLTIVVIGGLIRNSPRAEEYWQKLAQDVNSVLSSRENGECLDVLYLSYSHLPAHLKPCFLYMGTFKEDREIRVSEMIKLWVAEGFLKPIGVQILEEIAEDYLKDLIDRNLILVHAHRSNGKIGSCGIHDLLRELCISVANKEKFFCVVRAPSIPVGIDRERRLIFHDQTSKYQNNEVFEALQSAPLARSLLCNNIEVPVKCRLLRVLSKSQWGEIEIQNVNLRYFDFLIAKELHSSISLMWNVQTLIIRKGYGVLYAPLEIWKMPQLRHLKCYQLLLPDPPPSGAEDNSFDLGNLQTLTRVVNFKLSEEACKRIPNIKKLHLMFSDVLEGYDNRLYDTLQNLNRLHKLESLDIRFSETAISIDELKNAFPSSLNKLALRRCHLHLEDLSMIVGSLPQLEVLKLVGSFSEICKWSCVEGGFLRLKFLSIRGYGLKSWTLDSSSCFPVLEKLVLVRLWNLSEIPSGIGEIPTLQLIRLEDCAESAVISAMKIKDAQESFGNYGLLIQATMSADDAMRLRKRVEIEGLSINNIHLALWGRSKRRWMVICSAFRLVFAFKRIMARNSQ